MGEMGVSEIKYQYTIAALTPTKPKPKSCQRGSPNLQKKINSEI